MTGWVFDFDEAKKIAEEIQIRVREEVGDWLGCSIGISWTKFLTKFAGDIAPKKGILIIDSYQVLNKVLCNRPLTDAWGINIRTEARLRALGIKNLLELKNYSSDKIRRVLGRYGYYLWCNVNGIEIASVNQGFRMPKSVGHSCSLPKKTTDIEYLSTVLFKLCEKTGRRLRELECEAQSIYLGLVYVENSGFFRTRKMPEKMFTTEEIYRCAKRILAEANLLLVKVVSVSVSNLTPITSQMALFEDNLSKKDLSLAVDKLNDKYGEYTVVQGQMFGADNIARDRIGFRKTMEV
jgi:DNA polymerase-4